MSTSANNPVTRHVLKYKGTGAHQVFQNLPTMLNGPKDGSDVGTGGPGLPALEAPVSGNFSVNRNIEFLDDHYCLPAGGANAAGVFKKSAGGTGQWGRVQGGTDWQAADGLVSGLHILHPNGVPTLAYLVRTTGSALALYKTTDGITGTNWASGAFVSTDTSFAPINTGQSIVFRQSIVWTHNHMTSGAGAGAISQYDLENTTLTRYNVSGPLISTQLACNYSLHVHDNVVFLFGWDASANNFARVMKLQSGSFQTVWTSTVQSVNAFETTVTGHAGMFTDPETGNLIVFIHGINHISTNSSIQVVSIANATTVPMTTDITDTVLGPGPNPTSGDGAEKYKGAAAFWQRRWSVFVDSEADPLNPRTFLTTWGPQLSGGNGFAETWEWQGIDSDLAPVETGTGGQQGVSDDFARPYVTATGGERSPQTGSVELEGLPERAIGGTKFEFRGRRSASGTVAFYGDNGAGASTPSIQLPIIAGSLTATNGIFVSLVAYYHFNDDGLDASPSGFDLSPTGSPTFSAGLIGNGADYPGTGGDHHSTPNNVQLNLGSVSGPREPYALSVWVNLTTATSLASVVEKSNGANGWRLSIDSDGTVTWFHQNSSTLSSAASAITTTAGMQHIVVSSDGLVTRLYVDGIEVDFDVTWPNTVTSNSATVVGERIAGTNSLDGIVDELAIWQRKLSVSEITAIYNSGAGAVLEDLGGGLSSPSISGNTIVDFTCDDGVTLYSVILDAENAGIVPGAPGIIMADLV